MGKIVLAAKITHVPSLLISEREGPLKGSRDEPINSLKELGRRARDRGVDTFIVFDMHWLSNFGFHINATALQKGAYTSNEAPHMIQNMQYEYRGDPALGERIAGHGRAMGLDILSHDIPSLALEYGTIVPMYYMNQDASMKVVSLAANLFSTIEQNRQVGEAVRQAIDETPGNFALLASGSMSHQLITANETGDNQWNKMSNEFNRQVDLRVLDLWKQRRYKEFVDMLPEYSRLCKGEGLMCDTVMLFGALGWDKYHGESEQMGEYFPSSGSGQVNVHFSV